MSTINLNRVDRELVSIPRTGKLNLFFDLDGVFKFKTSDNEVFVVGGDGANPTEQVSKLVQNYPTLELVINDTQRQFNNAILGKVQSLLDLVPHPTYIYPTLSITNMAQIGEVGSLFFVNLNSVYNQNDAGSAISIGFKKNNVNLIPLLVCAENIILTTSSVSYKSYVSFAIGAIKNNSVGVPDPIGRILAGNVESAVRSVVGIYPIFYGVSNSIPNPSTINLSTLTKSVSDSSGNVSVVINANDSYLIIAIPTISNIKTKWYVTELNQGSIGGVSNLFGNSTTVNKNSPDGYWSGISYRFYISNYRTTVNTIQLKNL